MRLIIQSLIAFLFLSASCKKSTHNSDYSDSVEGTWELRKIVANTVLDYPPGSGNLLKFTENGYEQYINSTLAKSGTYSIVTESMPGMNCVPDPSKQRNRVIYDGKIDTTREYITISGNTLQLNSGGCIDNTYYFDSESEKQYVRK